MLLLGFGLLAFAMSPACCRVPSTFKQRALLVLPPLILLIWFLFQRELLLTGPMMRGFYRSMWGLTVWKLNSAILVAFGIGFSIRIVRTAGLGHRVYGTLCVLAFLPLLLGFNMITPAGPTEGLHYRLDAWRYQPANEPLAGGKSLSYWASRVDDLANQSEPAVRAIRSMGLDGVNALMREFQTGKGGWSDGELRPQPGRVRQRATEALVKLGPDSLPAVPLMIESLRSLDKVTREQAAEILGAAGDSSPRVINALIQSLSDEDTAYHAMKSLVRLTEKDPAIVLRLATTAKDSKKKAAYWAVVALSQVGPASQPVLADLIVCVQRGPTDSRQPAVQAIALIGTNATQAVPALITALEDSDDWTRKCIYIALGRIGPSASSALPILRSRLTNESYLPARMDIARALWRIDPGQIDRVQPAIKLSLEEGEREFRQERRLVYDYLSALDLIGEIGSGAGAFVPHVKQCLASGNPGIQLNAAWALWRVSPEEALFAQAKLRRIIGLDDYPLEQIGSDDWGRSLSELKRKRESFHPRIAALGALWQMDERARPTLAAATAELLRDWDFFTSMKGIIPEEGVAVPLLTAIESDPAHAKAHEAARKAKREILGYEGERW